MERPGQRRGARERVAEAMTSGNTAAIGAATVRDAFAPAGTLAQSLAYTRKLAMGHYENFSVVTLLVPRELRQDFCNVYAFCRTADDLGDESGGRESALEGLARFREETLACYQGRAGSLVFAALRETILRHEIPIQPFLDLIDAFEQDQRVSRYATFDELLAYCRRSANPVGRLVLYVCGYRDARRQELSDRTCTALQLANFWQDVRRDLLDLDRIYLPMETMARFGVTERALREMVETGRCEEGMRQALEFEVERTKAMFDEGEALLPLLDPSVRGQVRLFGEGGRAILRAIRRRNFDTVSGRPTVSAWQKGRLIAAALPGLARARMAGRMGQGSRA